MGQSGAIRAKAIDCQVGECFLGFVEVHTPIVCVPVSPYLMTQARFYNLTDPFPEPSGLEVRKFQRDKTEPHLWWRIL
jgi:hypothetical protein